MVFILKRGNSSCLPLCNLRSGHFANAGVVLLRLPGGERLGRDGGGEMPSPFVLLVKLCFFPAVRAGLFLSVSFLLFSFCSCCGNSELQRTWLTWGFFYLSYSLYYRYCLYVAVVSGQCIRSVGHFGTPKTS